MAPNNTLNSIIVKIKKIVTTSGMRVRVKYIYAGVGISQGDWHF